MTKQHEFFAAPRHTVAEAQKEQPDADECRAKPLSKAQKRKLKDAKLRATAEDAASFQDRR
jgi:hypothetical protein